MRFLIVTLLLSFGFASHAIDVSDTLVEEVLSVVKQKPQQFDWRRDFLQVEFGYSTIQELNTFISHSYNLGLSTSLGGPWILRGAVRKAETKATAASNSLAMTPFSQAAQPSRYEFQFGAGWALLDGRSQTALSSRITDIHHALYLLFGAQYNYFTKKDAEPVPAMRAIYYDFVGEVGLRWQLFLPRHLGLGFEWSYSLPLRASDPDLNSWQRYSGSLSWSFGD